MTFPRSLFNSVAPMTVLAVLTTGEKTPSLLDFFGGAAFFFLGATGASAADVASITGLLAASATFCGSASSALLLLLLVVLDATLVANEGPVIVKAGAGENAAALVAMMATRASEKE